METLRLSAPAKLNLFLHVTGRRADGYHLLQTVFQLLDYSDTITLSPTSDGKIDRLSDLAGVSVDDDITIRAAYLLQQYSQATQGVNITIDKHIPMGGGLGGGSSNAATVLRGCNKLWQCGLSDNELVKLGSQLGADVPVFIQGQSAWAEGIGEELTALELPEKWFVVVHPNVNVSTAEIFSNKGLTRDSFAITIRDFLRGQTTNDLQSIVVKQYPTVAEAIERLSVYAETRMTGSGSCVFATFANEVLAKEAVKAMPSKWKCFVAKGLNQSPLLSQIT